jgi:homoserine kinase
MSAFLVTVPATTANLGPGFDCLGAALGLYNHFSFSPADSMTIQVQGSEAARVSREADNLLYQSFARFYAHLGRNVPGVALSISLGVPLARGLGSSATAIVGGLVGANLLAGTPLSSSDLLDLAIAIEGHPDNVVPAFLGGCQLTVGERGNRQICQVPWQENIVPILGIPDFELSTEAARAVLPASYSRAAAIFNVAHLGLLLRGLETGNAAWLGKALEDEIHQPYRQALIPGYAQVKQAAIEAGAYGLVISGAGPTLLALSDRSLVSTVREAMQKTWEQAGIKSTVQALDLDTQGVKVQSMEK